MVTRTFMSQFHTRALAISFLFVTSFSVEGTEKEEEIARGAKAWSDNCSRCHNMREPDEFPDDLLRPIVYHMRVRAGLTGQETRDILEFLQSAN